MKYRVGMFIVYIINLTFEILLAIDRIDDPINLIEKTSAFDCYAFINELN